MEAPQSLEEAKAIYEDEKAKLRSAFGAIIGSRWLLAILATFVIAFGSNLLFAPMRLPHVAGIEAATAFMPDVDLGLVGEQIGEAREAAENQGASGRVQEILAENAERAPVLNLVMFVLCLVLLSVNLAVMTQRRWYTKG
jgi:predicted nucleic acid-binding Zn ribbon protein